MDSITESIVTREEETVPRPTGQEWEGDLPSSLKPQGNNDLSRFVFWGGGDSLSLSSIDHVQFMVKFSVRLVFFCCSLS